MRRRPPPAMTQPTTLTALLLALCIAYAGCVHRIHVTPFPVTPSATTIPRTLQVTLAPLSLEGADHRPGISLLDWSQRDLSQGIVGYIQQRGTFASVSPNPADLTLRVATKLSLTARRGLYHYRITLQADTHEHSRLLKSYLVDRTAAGSAVRWVTASDRDPIETALRLALEDLLERIEADRAIYINPTEQSTP